MSRFYKQAYSLGCKFAYEELGMQGDMPEVLDDDTEEQLQLQQMGGGVPVASAEDFVDFALNDDTEQFVDGAPADARPDEKPIQWGGKTSLEGGDAGTRNQNVGIGSFGGV